MVSGASEEGQAVIAALSAVMQKKHRDTSSEPVNIGPDEMAKEIARKQKNMMSRLDESLAYAVQQGFRYAKSTDGTRTTVKIWHSSEGGGEDGSVMPVEKGSVPSPIPVPLPGPHRKLSKNTVKASDVGAPNVPGLHVEGEELEG